MLLIYISNQITKQQLSFPTLTAQISEQNLIYESSFNSLLENVIIANIPQIIASIGYISYNQLLTSLLLTREFTMYSIKRANLRVTLPKEDQRSTLWLSLPYRFSLPHLIASTLLHWSISQTLFLDQLEVFAPNGSLDADHSFACLCWSALALLMSLIISLLMIAAPIALGFLHYPRHVPLVESNSLAISTACHRLPGKEGEERAKLKYGIIGRREDGTNLVGLSSGPVRALNATDYYEL